MKLILGCSQVVRQRFLVPPFLGSILAPQPIMYNFLNKIFKSIKKPTQERKIFLKIYNNTEVSKIFDVISNFNETSEIRYVGGCVRKILNQEVDDIDLAVNLNPDEVKECLQSNNIKFFETGIEHGTITANLGKKKF